MISWAGIRNCSPSLTATDWLDQAGATRILPRHPKAFGEPGSGERIVDPGHRPGLSSPVLNSVLQGKPGSGVHIVDLGHHPGFLPGLELSPVG